MSSLMTQPQTVSLSAKLRSSLRAIGCLIVSLLWMAINGTRRSVWRLLVRAGWTAPRRLPTRVVSVGNLEAGGTGKTPLVVELARRGIRDGKRVWILMRGYRGLHQSRGYCVLPHAIEPRDALLKRNLVAAGDEVALLARLVPEAAIGVGADRGASFDRLLELLGQAPDCVILDDGHQRLSLARDAEVVTLTSRRPWESVFREGPRSIDPRALTVWTKGEREPWGLRAPSARIRLRLAPPSAGNERVWLICGIGHPDELRARLREAGYHVERERLQPDHYEYREQELAAWLRQARDAGASIVTTGKDWVKWEALGITPASDLQVLEYELEWSAGASNFEAWWAQSCS